MAKFVRSTLAFICMVLLVSSWALAQESGDYPKSMPKTQRDIVEQHVALQKKYSEAQKLKNKIARQDALKTIQEEKTKWLAETNKALVMEGAKDWVGNATVTTQTIMIKNRVEWGQKSTAVTVVIPVAGLPKEVRDNISKLKKNELVRFSINSDKAEILEFAYSAGGLSASVKAKNVISITSQGGQ